MIRCTRVQWSYQERYVCAVFREILNCAATLQFILLNDARVNNESHIWQFNTILEVVAALLLLLLLLLLHNFSTLSLPLSAGISRCSYVPLPPHKTALLSPRNTVAWPLSLSNRDADVAACPLYALGIFPPLLPLSNKRTTPPRLSRRSSRTH